MAVIIHDCRSFLKKNLFVPSKSIEDSEKMPGASIGNIDVRCIVDTVCPFLDAREFLPDLTEEMLSESRRLLPAGQITRDGKLVMSFQSFLLRTEKHTILVDTCCGNHKDRPQRPNFHHMQTQYLSALRQTGLHPEQIDFVMCTHLHWDHVGWNTRLEDGKWVPTFPNAKYVIARQEFEYWDKLYFAGSQGINLAAFQDSVLPIKRADRAVLVENDHELQDGIRFEPCPGHSAGHVMINLVSGGESGIISGDAIHHRIQLLFPELATIADLDKPTAQQSRQRLINRVTDTDTLLLPAHFLPKTIGHVRTVGKQLKYV